jgi:protein SCO1
MMCRAISILSVAFVSFLSISCIEKKDGAMPVYGERTFDGKDTVYHTIANFEFVNQDSAIVTNETFKGKIYVADFFFTSCRTICPIMKTLMLRVYEKFENDPEVLILSHTIDPEYDTVGLLHDYADRLGVKSSKWHFVTGAKDSIYDIAQKSYFATAMEDATEPDGFIHSGAFLLIDKEQRIRGKYDGTSEADVRRLIDDIERLKEEYAK